MGEFIQPNEFQKGIHVVILKKVASSYNPDNDCWLMV